MNRIHDRTHRAASPLLLRMKRKALPLSLSLLGMAAGSCFPVSGALAGGPAANALPTGGTVITGVATVSSNANTMTINQTSAQVSMNWTSFDIGSGATVMFNQAQGASSVALNRIGIGSSSPVASQIYGALTAPGQVFLINPAGIVFGNGAQVSVGGLVASTLDVNGTTASNGHTYYDLLNSGGSASIINQGTISAASGGGVILVGGNVVNSGQIAASAGHIFLDGADRVTVDFDGNNLVNVVLTGALGTGPGTGAAVTNNGTLTADGGTIVLQASATPGLFTQMVNNTGVVQANSISGNGGTVQLLGTGGDVDTSGTISATGGNIAITSDGSIGLNGAVNAGSGQVVLSSQQAITQTANSGSAPASVITAGTLSGSSVNSTTLTQANQIQNVSSFSSGSSFSLTNGAGASLQVGGLTVSGGSVALGTAAGSDLTLSGNVNAQSLSLNSGGYITQSGGALTVAALSGTSSGSTTLAQINNITALGSFSANGFSLNNSGALAINGALNSGAATTTLNVTGTITEGAGGSITAGTLAGSSTGSTTLLSLANNITALGGFSASEFSLNNSGALAINGALNSGTGTTTLNVIGAITESAGGSITAGTLAGSSTGSTTLGQANNITALGNFSASGFSLNNSGALAINGALNSGTGTTTLNVAGAITEGAGGSITASTLAGSSTGSTVLTQANNAITNLGTYSSGGDFNLLNMGRIAQSGTNTLSVVGNTTLNAGANAISMGNRNQLNGAVNLTGGNTLINNAGALNLGLSNISGNLTATTANANAGISQSGALTVTGTSTFTADTTSGTGAISLIDPGNSFGSTVNLTGTGIAVVNQGSLTVGALSGGANGSLSLTSLNGGLNLPAASINTGTGDLTLVAGGGSFTPSGDLAGYNVSLQSYGALTLPYNVTATNALSLTSSNGGIAQSGGALTAAVLTGSSQGSTSLGQLNLITHLGNFTANGFSLSNAQTLTTTGTLNGGSGVALTTTTGDLALNGAISGTNVSLTSAGAITEGNGGSITTTGAAGALTSHSFGGTVLNQANYITTLGGFSAGSFSLTNAQTLGTTGVLNGGTGVALTTTSGDLALNGTMTGNTVALNAQGGISEGAGSSISTATLSGGSGGSTVLNQTNNNIANLGLFSSGGDFSLTNNGALTQSGSLTVQGNTTLNAGTHAITLTDSGNDLHGTVSLNSGDASIANDRALIFGASTVAGNLAATATNAAISQSPIATDTLNVTGTSSFNTGTGGITLTNSGNRLLGAVSLTGGDAQIVNSLGLIFDTSTLSGNLSASTTGNATIGQTANPLTVTGTSNFNAGTGAITLGSSNQLHGAVNLTGGNTLANNASALNLGASNISGNLVATTANTGAAISQSGALTVTGISTFTAGGAAGTGAITLADASNAFGSSVNASGTGITIRSGGDLRVANLIDGANGAVSLIAGGALYLPSTAIDTGSANLTLSALGGSLMTAGGLKGTHISLSGSQGISLANNVSAAGVLNLTSSGGAITQTGGVLSAPLLTGSSQGVTTLNQANQITQLGSFTANGFSLTNAGALTVNGSLNGNGSTALTTTNGDLTLQGTVSGTDVSLTANNGAVIQSGGAISAGMLSGFSKSSTSLMQGNTIYSLGNYHSGGDFSLADANSLIVSGVLSSVGNIALASGGNITLANAVNGRRVALNASAGTINQVGGTLTTGALTGQSSGTTLLNQTNQIGSLGNYTSGGDFSLTNGTAIVQSGSLQVQGATTLNAGTNAITLTNSANNLRGAVSLTGGDTQIANTSPLVFGTSQINGNLSVTSNDPAIGQVGALNVTGSSYFNAGNGSIQLTNASNQLAGPVTAIGTGIAITNAGDLQIASLTNGTNGAVSLISLGGTLFLPGAAINTGSSNLVLTSGGGLLSTTADLSGANVALTGSGGINLGNVVTAANNLSLVSGAAINQSAGALNARTLTGSSSGATNLMQANSVGSVGNFSANGFSLTNANGLTIAGPLLSTGGVTLITQDGDLDVTGTLSGGRVVLNAAGAINESATGNIVATTLSGRAGGATSLGTQSQPIANHISTLGGFQSPAGFSLTNGQTLTLASVDGSSYTVDAGTSALYLAVLNGSLLQTGTTPLYNGQGIYAASEHIGLITAPIYAFGTLPYVVEAIGLPPAYFYALDRQGNPLPEAGLLSINLPTTMSTSHAQNGNNRLDSYIDASIITASYRAYGIVPSGIRLPPDQEACDPETADCQGE
ncbi:Heme/hemopexin-binding protein [Dyella sp. AD56]|uniref:two-partner secretion domain-containing protein n=1 Tax=Dyella sp. AD56 TaxID=1528744 RepID=UPI000CA85D40|nr:filamentous hemagglutinin N-terminal domain-containing protein [Dyella sp. AD56]PMQ03788.1 Heme/hemopexin-binding protein [Dyella sp. AD56]